MSGKQQRNMSTAEPLVCQPEPLMCMADDQDLMGNEAIQAQMSQQSSDSGMSMLDLVPFMTDPLKEALSAGRYSGNDPTAMGMGAQAGDALGVLGAGLGVVGNLDKALNADSAAEAAVAGRVEVDRVVAVHPHRRKEVDARLVELPADLGQRAAA